MQAAIETHIATEPLRLEAATNYRFYAPLKSRPQAGLPQPDLMALRSQKAAEVHSTITGK